MWQRTCLREEAHNLLKFLDLVEAVITTCTSDFAALSIWVITLLHHLTSLLEAHLII